MVWPLAVVRYNDMAPCNPLTPYVRGCGGAKEC